MFQLWRISTLPNKCISLKVFSTALQLLKSGKARALLSIPGAITSCRFCFKILLNKFLSSCMCQLKFFKNLEKSIIILKSGSIPNPNKPFGDPKSYRPIFLLYVPFKILERFIYARFKPNIDSLLPREQAGFRRGRSTVDQVTLPTQEWRIAFNSQLNDKQSHSSLSYCMAPQSHLQATPSSSRQAQSLIIMELVRFSPPVPENKTGYDALKVASHKDSPGSFFV